MREPRVILQMLLQVVLVELFTAEGPEHGCQPPQRPNQTELAGHEIERHTDARALREPAPTLLGFALRLQERVSAGETVGQQAV